MVDPGVTRIEMLPGVPVEPGVTGPFGSVGCGGFRPVPEDESGLAA